MKQIIILGSKPYAIIPGGDKIYSANGATFGNKIKKSDFTDHINVAHVYTLEKGLNLIKPNPIHKQKLKAIINSGFERLVLFTSANDANSTLRVKNYFTHLNIKEIEVLKEEIEKLKKLTESLSKAILEVNKPEINN